MGLDLGTLDGTIVDLLCLEYRSTLLRGGLYRLGLEHLSSSLCFVGL